MRAVLLGVAVVVAGAAAFGVTHGYAVEVLLAAAAAASVPVARFAVLPPSARRYWAAARWHRCRWRRVTRNLGLARIDKHDGQVNTPPGHFRPDPFGWQVKVKLIPGVSRPEFEASAEHLANAWRCWRVGITQPKPGRLVLRGIRRDPLAAVLTESLPRFDGRRLYLGRDEWGAGRWVQLANLSGSVVGGNPGRGKSQLGTAFAVQLAPVANSKWFVLDGGGGADWACWADRAERFATDDLAEARDVLEDAHALMVKRLATLAADLGTRNAWTVGPSPDYPLVWVPVDEASVYLDLDAAKAAGKQAELQVRAIRSLVTGLLRRGRKVLFHTLLMSQKPTSSSVPPDIRDLTGSRFAFGVATTESAVAVLGDDIRQYPTLSPVQLQEAEHAGVCTARLRTGNDMFTRIRVPFVSEGQADAVALETARSRSVVTQLPALARVPGAGLVLAAKAAPEGPQRSPGSRAAVGRPA